MKQLLTRSLALGWWCRYRCQPLPHSPSSNFSECGTICSSP